MTYEIETDGIQIEYELVDSSFDHAFGTHHDYTWEITKIMVYIPAIQDWLDMSHTNHFDKLADKLVASHIKSLDRAELPRFMR